MEEARVRRGEKQGEGKREEAGVEGGEEKGSGRGNKQAKLT